MISFVGAGKVGTALGVYFKQKGCHIAGYYSRTYQHAIAASRLTHSEAFTTIEDLLQRSSMVWITVTDDALETVANEIAEMDIPPHVKAFIHTSGVHSSEILSSIHKKGFATYSLHPLMAFGTVDESVEQLRDAYFSVESVTNSSPEGKEKSIIDNLFATIGNKTLTINSDKKELYHCAATVLSNYMVTLLNVAYEMFEESGMSKSEIKKATAPLLRSTLMNVEAHDKMSDALTGPIKRGDKTTVVKHLEALGKYMPSKTALYRELGKETMEMIDDERLKDMLCD